MEVNVIAPLRKFRRFIILSTCISFIPEAFLHDLEVFPERPTSQGTVYVEAEDKVTVRRIRNMVFVRVSEVLGMIYNSKSGRTRLKWRNLREGMGKVTGEASGNSLVNLFTANILDASHAGIEMNTS